MDKLRFKFNWGINNESFWEESGTILHQSIINFMRWWVFQVIVVIDDCGDLISRTNESWRAQDWNASEISALLTSQNRMSYLSARCIWFFLTNSFSRFSWSIICVFSASSWKEKQIEDKTTLFIIATCWSTSHHWQPADILFLHFSHKTWPSRFIFFISQGWKMRGEKTMRWRVTSDFFEHFSPG